MSALPEFSLVRIKRPLTLTDYDGESRHLPAGTVGCIADVLSGGQAYIVEFLIEPGIYSPEGGLIELPLELDSILERADLEPAQ